MKDKRPRTKKEVQDEIVALKLLKPVGPFTEKTAATIARQIEELEDGIDQTAEEWDNLTDEQQDAVRETADWRDGYSVVLPSKEWTGLVE